MRVKVATFWSLQRSKGKKNKLREIKWNWFFFLCLCVFFMQKIALQGKKLEKGNCHPWTWRKLNAKSDLATLWEIGSRWHKAVVRSATVVTERIRCQMTKFYLAICNSELWVLPRTLLLWIVKGWILIFSFKANGAVESICSGRGTCLAGRNEVLPHRWRMALTTE